MTPSSWHNEPALEAPGNDWTKACSAKVLHNQMAAQENSVSIGSCSKCVLTFQVMRPQLWHFMLFANHMVANCPQSQPSLRLPIALVARTGKCSPGESKPESAQESTSAAGECELESANLKNARRVRVSR